LVNKSKLLQDCDSTYSSIDIED